jgi:hypothetical protein
MMRLDRNPLHLIERNLIPSSIIKPGCPGRLVRGHLLRDFQLVPRPIDDILGTDLFNGTTSPPALDSFAMMTS